MEKKRLTGKIERITIPGEATADWMSTLLEGGFSAAEAERIIENISPDYRNMSQEEQLDVIAKATADWMEKEGDRFLVPAEDVPEKIHENIMKALKEGGRNKNETK